MTKLELFKDFLSNINDIENQKKIEEILLWVNDNFELDKRVAWNQPMFTDHETFIVGFSIAKNHISVAPESKAIAKFSQEILKSNYTHTKEIFRIKWSDDINYNLLKEIIEYNIEDKQDYDTFWRKP